jgi:hypothetical protein
MSRVQFTMEKAKDQEEECEGGYGHDSCYYSQLS